jgi:heme/copper-type cytochrome/quinol oxidase subunit 2
MKGRVTIVSREEYDEWLDKKYREQTATVDSQVAAQGEGE